MDDDEKLRALLVELLARAGYRVHTAATGEAALDAARAGPPALVVLDVQLPGMSGYEVCRALRAAQGNSVRILFLSGARTEHLDRVAGLLLGGDDYLVKPFAPDELLARVHVLLRHAHPPSRDRLRDLTPRELQVLRLLAGGLDQKAVAARLVISPNTVATHIEHILGKLGARSRAHAVSLALSDDISRNSERNGPSGRSKR